MKSILKASWILLFFSASILLFQLSCQKELIAQDPAPTVQNKVVYTKTLKSSSTPSPVEIWTCNIDGTGQQKVNVSIPSGQYIEGNVRVSADGKRFIFNLYDGSKMTIYTCLTDGSSLTQIVAQGTNETNVSVNDVY